MRFGEVIKDARSRQGWDQARFAELLGGVGQQTVSRWERGLSRPRRAVVIRLAELLELNARDLLTAAGYTETTDNVGDVAPPVQPRSTTLPLDKLAPEVFEQFSADLAQALHPDATVHRYGSQGHTQGGIDIEVRRPTGKPIGIQCKRETRFGPANRRYLLSWLAGAVLGSAGARAVAHLRGILPSGKRRSDLYTRLAVGRTRERVERTARVRQRFRRGDCHDRWPWGHRQDTSAPRTSSRGRTGEVDAAVPRDRRRCRASPVRSSSA